MGVQRDQGRVDWLDSKGVNQWERAASAGAVVSADARRDTTTHSARSTHQPESAASVLGGVDAALRMRRRERAGDGAWVV